MAIGVSLIPCVNHAHTLDGALCDAIDGVGCGNAGRFEDGRHDINNVVELTPDATHVLNVAGPGHAHSLARPAEMRRHLLAPI